MSKSSSGAHLHVTASSLDTFALIANYTTYDDRASTAAASALSKLAARQVSDHRIGVPTYAFCKRQGRHEWRFVEVYSTVDDFIKHIDGQADELSVATLFDGKTVRRHAATVAINPPSHSDYVNGALSALQPLTKVLPRAGFLWRDLKARASAHSLAIAVIRLEPVSDTSHLLTSLEPVLARLSDDTSTTAAFVLSRWWPKQEDGAVNDSFVSSFSDNALELTIVTRNVDATLASFSDSAATVGLNTKAQYVLIALAKGSEVTKKTQEKLAGIHFPIKELAVVEEGYVLHPALCGQSTSSSPPSAPPPQPKAPQTGGNSAANGLFSIGRHAITNEAQFLVFNKNAPGRSPHLEGKVNRAQGDTNDIEIPLLHMLRKLCLRGNSLDVNIPINLVFCVIERLRSLQRRMDLANSRNHASELDPESSRTLLELANELSGLGYTLPEIGRRILVPGLEECIHIIETEFAEQLVVCSSDNDEVSYMGLLGVFSIGMEVVANVGVGGVTNGQPVAFRVTDAYFSPQRGMLGGTKFNFKLGLQLVLPIADDLAIVTFEEVFEEFRDLKRVRDLPFRLLRNDKALMERLTSRGEIALSMATRAPKYLKSTAGAFTPKTSARGGSAYTTGNGKCIIDVVRALEAGCSLAPGFDNCSDAVVLTVRAWRSLERAHDGNRMTRDKRAEAAVGAGLRLVNAEEVHSNRFAVWPLTLGFSLDRKCWGSFIAESLSPVTPDMSMWHDLVIEDDMKRLLMATARASLYATSSSLLTAIGGARGAGMLYLLYGEPGTGKTMTVEALAAALGSPLYSVSFAELGSSVAELETRLADVMAVCTAWGAMVLLDEGDALVERREKGAFQLNSMTGVLLRHLENFSGALFITSNRASTLDPAALSRITLAIHYEPLSLQGKVHVWETTLRRAGAADSMASFDLKKLAAFSGSGRDIVSIVRLAAALAIEENSGVNAQHVNTALSAWGRFREELSRSIQPFEDAQGPPLEG